MGGLGLLALGFHSCSEKADDSPEAEAETALVEAPTARAADPEPVEIRTPDERIEESFFALKEIVAGLLGDGPLGRDITYEQLKWNGGSVSYLMDETKPWSRIQGSLEKGRYFFERGQNVETLRWTMAALNFRTPKPTARDVRRNLYQVIELTAENAAGLRRWPSALKLADLIEDAYLEEFHEDHVKIPTIASLIQAHVYTDAGIRDLGLDQLRQAQARFTKLEHEAPDSALGGVTRKLLVTSSKVRLAAGDRKRLLQLAEDCKGFLEAGRDLRSVPAYLQLHLGVDALARFRSGNDKAMGEAATSHLQRALSSPNLGEQDQQEAEIAMVELILLTEGPNKCAEAYRQLRKRLEGGLQFLRSEFVLCSLGVQLSGIEGTGLDPDQERAQLQAAFDEMLASWNAGSGREEGTGILWSDDRVDALVTLCGAHLATDDGGSERALEQLLAVEQVSTLARTLGAEAPSRTRIDAALLGEGAGLLVMLSSTRSGWIVALRKGDPPLWVPYTLNLKVRGDLLEWTNLLGRSPGRISTEEDRRERMERLAVLEQRFLGALIPAEIESWIQECSSLYLVHGEVLGRVGFEAIPVGGARLGLSMPMVYLPSITAGVALSERAVAERYQGKPRLALLSASNLSRQDQDDLDLESLPFRKKDADALTSPFSQSRWIDHVEDGAKALAEVSEGGFSWVQVVAHGGQDLDRERSSVVLLEKGGRFGDQEASGLSLPPGVFVAACGSGQGPIRSGDAASASLAGVLLSGGARVTILPISSVPYEAGLVLMQVFNQNIANGASAGLALQRARLSLSQDPLWSDPAYWASFQAVGVGL